MVWETLFLGWAVVYALMATGLIYMNWLDYKSDFSEVGWGWWPQWALLVVSLVVGPLIITSASSASTVILLGHLIIWTFVFLLEFSGLVLTWEETGEIPWPKRMDAMLG